MLKIVSTQIATQTEIVTLRLSRLSECCRMITLMQYQEKDLLILHQSGHTTVFHFETRMTTLNISLCISGCVACTREYCT